MALHTIRLRHSTGVGGRIDGIYFDKSFTGSTLSLNKNDQLRFSNELPSSVQASGSFTPAFLLNSSFLVSHFGSTFASAAETFNGVPSVLRSIAQSTNSSVYCAGIPGTGAVITLFAEASYAGGTGAGNYNANASITPSVSGSTGRTGIADVFSTGNTEGTVYTQSIGTLNGSGSATNNKLLVRILGNGEVSGDGGTTYFGRGDLGLVDANATLTVRATAPQPSCVNRVKIAVEDLTSEASNTPSDSASFILHTADASYSTEYGAEFYNAAGTKILTLGSRAPRLVIEDNTVRSITASTELNNPSKLRAPQSFFGNTTSYKDLTGSQTINVTGMTDDDTWTVLLDTSTFGSTFSRFEIQKNSGSFTVTFVDAVASTTNSVTSPNFTYRVLRT